MNPKDQPKRLKALIARLQEKRALTPDDLTTLSMAWQQADRLASADNEAGISVTSLVSNTTGEGRIDLCWLGQISQLSPAEARSTAWILIEAASVAESEAMLVRFLKEEVGLEADKASNMLHAFRQYREQDPQSLVDDGAPKH